MINLYGNTHVDVDVQFLVHSIILILCENSA